MEYREDTPLMAPKLNRRYIDDSSSTAITQFIPPTTHGTPHTERKTQLYDDAMADLLDRSGTFI